MNRRKFVNYSLKGTAATIFAGSMMNEVFAAPNEVNGDHLKFVQNPLPYAYNALEPFVDAMTMEIHYSKHHAAYVKNVNEAIDAEHIHMSSPEQIFANITSVSAKVRNNGGGAWNHNFFWEVMSPKDANPLYGKLADAINAQFGSLEQFKEAFSKAAMGRFGSGWAWLVKKDNQLVIGSTANQDNPLMSDAPIQGTPLLALDVWEHAYYLKYQNKRNEYIANWWNVVNWSAVASKL